MDYWSSHGRAATTRKPRLFARGLQLIIMITLLSFLATQTANASEKLPTIDWPFEFNFTYAIESESYSLGDFYRWYQRELISSTSNDFYGLALASQTLGLVKRDPAFLALARKMFESSLVANADQTKIRLAKQGIAYIDAVINDQYDGEKNIADDNVAPITIEKVNPPAPGFKSITLGLSSIHVARDTRIKTQVDRVTRDWLQGFNIAGSPATLDPSQLATWHEGKIIHDLVDMTNAKVSVVTGTKVRRFGNDWYGPDAEHRYRFKIAEDKVLNVPTNFIVNDRTVIINDTHGINALAWDALDANLVIGCGDAEGKMEAAYYLAQHGVDVMMPTDRMIGMLIGADIKGSILGTAPIRKTDQGAVIGNQPITFSVDEPIVVTSTKDHYPIQYYDAPTRYFNALQLYARKKLNIVEVEVTKYGHAEGVIDTARQIGANLVAMRVRSKDEHDAVASWLKENDSHRAILFHSAVYPPGYRLFSEFPRQTSFGDIHPRFNYSE